MIIAGAVNRKPVSMQALTGAASILVADLALFGIHMDPDQRGSLVAALGVAVGIIFHLLHVTVADDPAATAITRPSVPLSGYAVTSGSGTIVDPDDLQGRS